jgi:predicted RNA-binding Zn ribbon-like protein
MPPEIQHRTFQLIAGDPVADFVNTLDWRFRAGGAEELLGSYQNLLRFCEQAGVLTGKQVRALQRGAAERPGEKALAMACELREASADFLYAELEERKAFASTVRTLESLFRQAQARRQLRRYDGVLGWDWAEGGAEPELPVWALALRAEELMTGERMKALRECGNPECRWLFLDTSKNHTRRWCDMKICGNRMKARRFKALHRD